MPILISEIHHDQAAERCGRLYVGDAILTVNGQDLRQAKHAQAVEVRIVSVTANVQNLC